MAALQRARQRQARIEAATGRAVRARAALERANRSRELAIERHDEKVVGAEVASVREAAELAKVCGSTEAAAEILGLSLREMRRLLKSDVSETSARPKNAVQRSGRREAGTTERGDGDGPLGS
ncbi:hypothetical protein [Kribbella lupini]|uniref:hypothetical protein n=1 Tax=Kribbella lupini TaxID=291602 RepID=UPI0031DB5A5C